MTFCATGTADYVYRGFDAPVASSVKRSSYVTISDHSERDIHKAIDNWHEEVMYSSSIDYMQSVKSFDAIVNVGANAIPMIIEDLQERPSFLFLALHAITGVDPIFNEIRGNVGAMVGAWLKWYEMECLETA